MNFGPLRTNTQYSCGQESLLPPVPELENFMPNEFAGQDIADLINAELNATADSQTNNISRLQIPAGWCVTGKTSGPRAVIVGGIHGNEPAGATWIRKVLRELRSGEKRLQAGELILAIGNPVALKANTRDSSGFNLNRGFVNSSSANLRLEDKARVDELRQILRADNEAVLDIHSTSQPTPPFVLFSLGDQASLDLVSVPYALGLDFDDPHKVMGTLQAEAIRLGSRPVGGVRALTLECGQHNDLATFNNAEKFALEFLSHLRMIELPASETKPAPQRWIMRCKLPVGNQPFKFAAPFRGFTQLHEGQLIGCDDTYAYSAPRDCMLIMPFALPPNVAPSSLNNEDWFYLATLDGDNSDLQLQRRTIR